MAILGINAQPVRTNNMLQAKNVQTMTNPMSAQIRATLERDQFVPSGKTNPAAPRHRFVNNYPGKASKEMVNLEQRAEKGGNIEVKNYPNGNVKEKNFFDEKTGDSIKQTFFANGNPQSEHIQQKAGSKWIEVKKSEYHTNGNIKRNEEFDTDAGKHIIQNFDKNGMPQSERLQAFASFQWNDVRKTDFYPNGNIKRNEEFDANYGRHITQSFYEDGNAKSLDVKKYVDGEWTSVEKAEYNPDGTAKTK